MTNSYPPSDGRDESPIYTDTARTAPLGTTPESGGAGGQATQAASDLGHSAKEAGGQVAGTAKEEASKVASEAKSQARDLLHQSRGELTEQAAGQQKRVAQGLRSVGEELEGMSAGSEQSGLATELVGQAASRLQGVAGWLDDRDPGSLLSEVKQFAARRPGVFIGVAAAAGLLAGRLTKGLIADAKDDSGSASAPSTPAAPSTPVTPATPVVDIDATELDADDPLLDADARAAVSNDPQVGIGGLAEQNAFRGGLR